MFNKLYSLFASFNLSIWLMVCVIVLFAVGSFSGSGAETSSINDMALFAWLREVPVAFSWWLWLIIGLLAVLALNTVLCSIESLRSKYRRTNFLAIIAPQVMHAGFLLIALAHLFSAYGGQKGVLQVHEGQSIGFPDGSGIMLKNITGQIGSRGMLTSYQAEVKPDSDGKAPSQISPNNPFFYRGFGIYLKDVQLFPERIALVEIHREPGAGVALAGALLFTIGNIVLIAVRRGK